MILFEKRASIVLYKVLQKIKQKFFLLPLNICPIVPDTLKKANKEFKFIDIDLTTLCMNETRLLNEVDTNKKVDGILFVRTFGVEYNTQPLFKKIKNKNKNIFIIDDMCLSKPEFHIDIENFYTDMILFSTGYSKYIDLSFGGYGFLKNSSYKDIFENKEESISFIKYKNTVLKKIPLMDKQKKQINALYTQNLPRKLFLGTEFNRWRFSILVENKDEILNKIFETNELFASSHYSQVDLDYVINPQIKTNTSKIHKKIINLFNDFRYNEDKVLKTCEIINKILK